MKKSSGNRLRNWIACYAAAITIMLEQVSAYPGTSVTEAPTPLVRLRDHFSGTTGWHPDEVLTGASGRQYIIVWEEPLRDAPALPEPRILSN